MISICYSTRSKNDTYKKYITSLMSTKGSEVIEIENPGMYSLTQAYNMGLAQSKNQYVVFIHDDLELQKGFDTQLLKYFKSSDYGILGIAGTTKLNKSAIWWENSALEINFCGQVWHQTKVKTEDGKEKLTPRYKSTYSDHFENQILPVVTVDGLFLAVDKNKLVSNFDERITGFHFYDISFCISNFIGGVQIGVITDLYCFHKSIGELKPEWYKNKDLFLSLYEEHLPLHITPEIVVPKSSITIKKEPSLAIIILSKNNFEYLERCVNSIFNKSTYKNYQIFIGDTGSSEETIQKIKDTFTQPNVTLLNLGSYNFARNNNEIVKILGDSFDLLLFCNDDIELINDSINEMVNFYVKNKSKNLIGTLGAKLYYENGRIQHGGVYLSAKKEGLVVGHIGIHSFYGKNNEIKEVVANTGAFLMIEKKLFDIVGGFPHTDNCFEDVILNLQCKIKGNKHNYIVGKAINYHFESISRKKEGEYNEKIQHDLKTYLAPFVMKHGQTLNIG